MIIKDFEDLMKTKSTEYDSLFGFLTQMGPLTKLLSRHASKF